MPEKDKNFHEFALKSILFKGRNDWYFCYLKAEKVAHVLALLSHRAGLDNEPQFEELVRTSAALPNTIAHFAAGEVGLEVLLADLFILLSSIRLAATNAFIAKENADLLIEAYEELAQKMSRSSHPSPFISSDDLLVPPLPLEDAAPLLSSPRANRIISDTKRQPLALQRVSQGQTERSRIILDYIKKHKQASIKDLSTIITDCSEKTIQRELALLIQQGLVRKEGERRWSVYLLV